MDKIPEELEDYKVDDLFLLVGGNPLPNAVAGRILLKRGGRIVLVYSDQTSDVRRHLKSWLEDQKYKIRASVESVWVEPSAVPSLYAKIREKLEGVEEDRKVGLHYTGGKKSMAVHAYRALAEAAHNPVMTYLDSATLELRIDPPDPSRPGGKNIYVGDALNLKVEDLIELHGWKLSRGAPSQTSLMLNTARALLDVYTEEAGDEALDQWKRWKGQWRRAWSRGTDRNGNASDKLLNWEVALPGHSSLKRVAEALKGDLEGAIRTNGEHFEVGFLIGEAADVAGFDSADDFCRWLDGSWLESIVLDALKQASSELGLNDACMGFHLKPKEGKHFEFEFDVIALRGHQLFAFSCTTETEVGGGGRERNAPNRGWKLLKQKLFEVYVRARQFGGTEARMALVCMANDTKGLQREARRDIWAKDEDRQRLRVFGRRDVEDLPARLTEWIKSQAGNL